MTLSAATFIFVLTNSTEDIGRAAKKFGSPKLVDQNSHFTKPLPTTKDRTNGIITIRPSTKYVKSGSWRLNHEKGSMLRITNATQAGNSQPVRRHSNQNCAAAGEAKSRVRIGIASMSQFPSAFVQLQRHPPPCRCRLTLVKASTYESMANPIMTSVHSCTVNHGE